MSESAYPDALQPQYRLHWYTIERVLGQGGFGITYLARDTNLDQLVAVKEYLPVEVASRRPDSTVRSRSDTQRERYRWGLDRFIQEARTLARFDHPNIVRVHSVFEFNGTAYMVMRFEEGDNLAALLQRRGTLPERDLLRILLPVLDGLELVHNAGFIHRDIKPDNIHIRADGSPVLLDFGSARHSLGKAHTLTILVAPGYAPFEQYHSSSENQGPWTDIYGLGATCYRAISGTQPMDAITRSKGILGSTREVLVPARTVGSGRYSAYLLAAVDHALEFNEKNRPQTVAEWRHELLGETAAASAAPAAAGKPAGPTPQPAAPPASVPTPQPAIPPQPQSPVIRSPWSSGPVPWAVAGVAAGAIGIAVFLWSGSTEREDRRFRQIQEQLDQAQKRLAEVGDRDGKEREKVLALLAEQQKLENSKRRQEEEARKRLEEKQQLAEARLRREEDARRRLEEKQQLAEARLRKEEEARRRLEEQARQDAVRREAEARLALAKPVEPAPPARRSPQEEQLAMGEVALARREYDEALKILRPLAQGGDVRAQDRLAEMYANGFGVTRNYNQAYIWYSLAARGGSTTAPASRDKMARLLQPVEVQQADRLVENWRAR